MPTSLLGTLCKRDVKRIGFFGYGISNRKIHELLIKESDGYSFSYRSSTKQYIPDGFAAEECRFGDAAYTDITEDVIFISPSVRRTEGLIYEAQKSGCILSSDTELFFSASPARVIAITGSDGKSTVTHLTSKLTESELHAPPSGNFGLPLVSLLKNGECSGAVVELSSFQLQYTKPRVFRALITNITENHLIWHKDFAEYVDAKRNIFKNAKCRAITLDTPICRSIAAELSPEIIISSEHSALELSRLYSPEFTVTLEGGYIMLSGKRLLSVDDILLKEAYNIKNFMSAIALSAGLTDTDTIRELAKSFRGLPHRKELVRKIRGVSFINSSIDSTPERTAKTLGSLGMPAVAIVGGAAKGLSYAPLIRALSENARAVVLTGEASSTLYPLLSSLRDFDAQIYLEEDFDAAVELAAKIARPDEAVVLSPAHTSYDRFSSFEERGEKFRTIIKNL